MNLKNQIAKYEALPLELVGKAIQKVSYYEIDYGVPSYDCKDYHSLDFGLQFDTVTGECFYFIWDSQIVQFDLKFNKGKITQELNVDGNVKSYDVSQNVCWKDLIGLEIEKIKSAWSWSQYLGEIKTYYPQDLELTFENNRSVIVSALEITSDGSVNSMADHISVFFDKGIAEKYGVNKFI